MTAGSNWGADAALRPQPARTGPDLWPTPWCLIRAMIDDVLSTLPPGRVWEPAAGDNQLAEAMRSAGREVVASDILSLNFLIDIPPGNFAAIITNPPFSLLDPFLDRALSLLDAGTTQSAVLLMRLRWDHLTAKGRTRALNRAAKFGYSPGGRNG